jgi:hypothetical protein
MRARLLVLALLAAPAAAQDAWPSLHGSGLLTLPDTATLAPRRVVAAFALDNRDRDPLGLDLLDGALLLTAGVARGTEVYGALVLSRVAALPEPPPLPPPPLDLIVAPGSAAPTAPHHTLFAGTPYVNKRGSARFDAWVPGGALLGVKRRLSHGRASRPALAVSVDLELPRGRELRLLQSGSGTGGWGVGGRLAAAWGPAARHLVATASYMLTGEGSQGDRRIDVDAGGARVTDSPLELPDRLELGLAYRHELRGELALVAEALKVLEVGARTPTLDAAPPLDVLAGLQLRLGRARVSAGLRYHANPLESGRVRPSPLAGLVDLTDVAEHELAGYLEAVGASAALPHLREGAPRVIATNAGQPLPVGARRLPDTYRIRSEHQVGFVVTMGWAF